MKRWSINSSKFLNREQLSKYVTYAQLRPEYERGVLLGLLYSGVRAAEAVNLKVADYSEGSLSVIEGKGGVSRTILLSDDADTFFKALVGSRTSGAMFLSSRGTPWSKRGLQRLIERTRETLGMRFTAHSMRHTYIGLLIQAGVPIPTIRDNAGHSSIATTDIYSHCFGKIDVNKLF